MSHSSPSPSISRSRFLSGTAAVGAGALALPALTSCGSEGEVGTASTGSIVFIFNGDPAARQSYDELFRQFSEEHPGIEVDAQNIAADSWADFLNAVTTRIAGGAQMDVIQVATEGQKLFANRDQFEPLDDFIARDRALIQEYYQDTPDQLREWLQRYGSPDERTYYMPTGYNTMAMYVRNSIFEEAGVAIPQDGWSWEDYRAAGEEIREATGAFLYPAASEYFQHVLPWLVTNGTNAMDEEWTRPTLDTPEAIESLEYVRSLVVDGLAPAPGGTYDAATLFAQGKLATFGGGRWPIRDLRRLEVVDDATIVPWPDHGTRATCVGWEGWPILKSSRNKETAWTFLKFLISREYGEAVSDGTESFVPARLSITESAAYTENAPANVELLADQVPEAVPLPAPEEGPEFFRICQEAWLQGITGTKTARQALMDAQDRAEDLFA